MKKSMFARVASPVFIVAVGLFASREVDAADTPKFSTLPVGRITISPLKKGPEAIGARESVPGFYLAVEAWRSSVPVQHRTVSVVGDPRVAEVLNGATFKRASREVEDTSRVCFAESQLQMMLSSLPKMDVDALNALNAEWGTGSSFTAQAQVHPKSKDNPRPGVTAIHSEKVVEQNGTASLESVDAWVDPASRGVRLIGKASLPLTLISTTVGGVKVFAGRDERPDGKRFVQFVVVGPREDPAGLGRAMWATKANGEVVHGGCDHLRVGLPVDAPGGDHAHFQTHVVLPSESSELAQHEPQKHTIDNGGGAGSSDSEAEVTEKELRTRAMEVQVSLSKTSKDKEPVVSVSFGWASREQTQRVAVDTSRSRRF
jgi:hypothetical protein